VKTPNSSDSKPGNSSDRSTILDALRAIAILLVLGRHTYITEVWTKIGWCGVDLFFVISGFLISGLLFQEYKRFGDIQLKRFWVRRGLKIYPALYIYTLVLVVIYPLALGGLRVPLRQTWVDLTFLSSYFVGLSGHTWSLAVEEHFYIVLPLFLLLLIKVGPKRSDPFKTIPLAFLLLAISSLLFRLAARPTAFTDYYAYMFPTHMRMDALFCGVTIGYLFHFKPQFLARFTSWRLLIAGAMLLAPVFFLEMGYRWMYTWGLTTTYLGFACILTWAVHQQAPQRSFMAVPIKLLARIGFYSYSIYLWHWLVIEYVLLYIRRRCILTGTPFVWTSTMDRLQWPVAIVASIIVGIAMAALIEVPVLRLRDRWFPSRTRVSTLTKDAPLSRIEGSPVPSLTAS